MVPSYPNDQGSCPRRLWNQPQSLALGCFRNSTQVPTPLSGHDVLESVAYRLHSYLLASSTAAFPRESPCCHSSFHQLKTWRCLRRLILPPHENSRFGNLGNS